MPDQLAPILAAVGHSCTLARDVGLAERDDVELLRALPLLQCDWLISLDLNREESVWREVYTELAEGRGRLIRLRPVRRRVEAPEEWIAFLASYVVDAYQVWGRWLEDDRVRMIELGRAVKPDKHGRLRPARGSKAHQAYTRAEVAGVLQQRLGASPRRNLQQQTRRRSTDGS